MTSNSPRFFSRLKPRALLATAGVLAAVGAAIYVATPNRSHAAQASAPSAPPAPKVTVAPVEQQLVTDYEELTGHVDATETVELRARVSGHLEEVRFQAGQLVQKGDVLFTIDPRWYKAQFDLATARADVASREAAR